MSKLTVFDRSGGNQPFLRGILTRSLQKAGLSFSDAHEAASRVRESLEHFEEVTTRQVREEVSKVLLASHGEDVERGYAFIKDHTGWIPITRSGGHSDWFSRNLFQHRLETCGLPQNVAEQLTHVVYERLLKHHPRGIERESLRKLTEEVVALEAGEEFASNYRAWRDFFLSKKPLILMIGGAPGVGKSTMSTEIATRLNITRSQSTDMLREVMRTLVAPQLTPELHHSSFDAWKASPSSVHRSSVSDLIIEGFHRQADLVEVATEAVLQRALRENVSLLLEGVHVRPSLAGSISADTEAVVVPIMLAVTRKKTLQRFLQGRFTDAPDRRAQRYLENFDAIWQLQESLLDDAHRANIPVIINDDRDSTLTRIMRVITAAVAACPTSQAATNTDRSG